MIRCLFFTLICVICFACQGELSKSGDKSSEGIKVKAVLPLLLSTDTAEYSISLEEAQELASNFRYYQEEACRDHVVLRMLTVRSSTLLQAMGIDPSTVTPPYDFARVYLGQHSNGEYTMMMLPVENVELSRDDYGTEVIPNGPYIRGPKTGSGQDTVYTGAHVFQFLFPCPNMCPPSVVSPN